MELPSSGQVIVNGQTPRQRCHAAAALLPAQHRPRVPDHQLLFESHRVRQRRAALQIAALDSRDSARRVRAALDKVGLLHKENQNPVALSSGEQQRVGIARAVVNKPLLLLADEPTGNLDPELAAEIMNLFEPVQQRSASVC